MSVSTMARVGVGKLSCRLALHATSTTVSLSLVLPKLPIKSESLSELWSLGCSWSSMLRNLIGSCSSLHPTPSLSFGSARNIAWWHFARSLPRSCSPRLPSLGQELRSKYQAGVGLASLIRCQRTS